jgi:hypothetical protein
MDERCKYILIAMIISATVTVFFVLLSINPLIGSVEHSLIEQMTRDTVIWILIADFFILTIVFYFLIYMRGANKSKI